MSRVISLDYETFYDKKAGYGISELGQWKYCDDPRFDPYMISVSDGSETWAGHPKDFNWSALEGATLLSHNKAFDATVYEAMVRKGMAPRVAFKEWHCTANMSAYLCNRRSLKDACGFLLGVELSKETRDYATGKHWEDMVADGRSEEMLTYARSDALHCHALFAKYGHLWPRWERKLSELTIWQGDRGVQIDVPLLKEYIVIATQMLQATEETLPWMKEGKKPTSPKAIAEECRKYGIPCPPVKSHFDDGQERFDAWEKIYGAKHPWIANVANWRSINKFLDSLQTIAARIQDDGIFTFGLKYFGAHTGRWSGDSGFNMQNLRKFPLFRDENRLLICQAERLAEIDQCEAKNLPRPGYVTAVLDIRKLFIARAGKKLILSDLSQIEPRVLAALVGDTAMLDLMRQGISPYVAFARTKMGWKGGDMKKENKDGYALAKAQVLGLGFGCAWEKFITVAHNMAGIDIAKDDPEFIEAKNEHGEVCLDGEGKPILISGYGMRSKQIVAEYRADNPLIASRDPANPGIWKTLDDGFKNSAQQCPNIFEIELPSGRKLRYLDVRRECRTVRNEETGKHERKWITTAEIGGRRYPLYGGLLTENAVQATARDVFGEQVLELQDTAGIDVLWTSHDEAITECDQNITKKEVADIMSKPPLWMPDLPVSAEAVESLHYLK
jgi:DNA polymerase